MERIGKDKVRRYKSMTDPSNEQEQSLEDEISRKLRRWAKNPELGVSNGADSDLDD